MPTPVHQACAILGALILAMGCGSSGGAGTQRVTPPSAPALGSVSVVSAGTCARGPGSLPNTSCMQLMIDDLGIPAIEVELRITEADAGTTPRGSVVLGTGLFGTSFYADEAGGDMLLPSLTAAGFRVIDRAWVSGWFASGSAVLPQSARYATLVTWIKDNLHTEGAFCVSGNSGGSAEIAYALTSWQRADIIDAAVLTSGPPLSRLDYLCENPPSSEWVDICRNIVPAGALECGTQECVVAVGNPLCALLPPNPQPGQLLADSVMHAAATMDYPNTKLYGLLGAEDCSSALPLALFYLNAVSSMKTIDIVSGARHLLPSSASGRSAIFMALLDAAPVALPITETRTRSTDLGVLETVELRREE